MLWLLVCGCVVEWSGGMAGEGRGMEGAGRRRRVVRRGGGGSTFFRAHFGSLATGNNCEVDLHGHFGVYRDRTVQRHGKRHCKSYDLSKRTRSNILCFKGHAGCRVQPWVPSSIVDPAKQGNIPQTFTFDANNVCRAPCAASDASGIATYFQNWALEEVLNSTAVVPSGDAGKAHMPSSRMSLVGMSCHALSCV